MRKIKLTDRQRRELATLPERCDWCGEPILGIGSQFIQPAPGRGTLQVMTICRHCERALSVAGMVAREMRRQPLIDIDGLAAEKRNEMAKEGNEPS